MSGQTPPKPTEEWKNLVTVFVAIFYAASLLTTWLAWWDSAVARAILAEGVLLAIIAIYLSFAKEEQMSREDIRFAKLLLITNLILAIVLTITGVLAIIGKATPYNPPLFGGLLMVCGGVSTVVLVWLQWMQFQ